MMRIRRVMATLAGSALLLGGLIAAPTAAVAYYGDEAVCDSPGAIVGTSGNDTLSGTSGDDIICGLDGNDTISGGGGNDTVVGGYGNDYVGGDEGDDSLLAGMGNDYIAGGPGADNLFGGDGADQLLAGAGDDSLNGGSGSDVLNGESGTDTCQKDRADRLLSCYYDKAGPKLVNIAINAADANLDSTDPNRTLHIQYTLSDAGTGVANAMLVFASAKNYSTEYKNAKLRSQGKQAKYPSPAETIQATVSVQYGPDSSPCSTRSNYIVTYTNTCRVSGTATRGVYETEIRLPRNMETSAFRLTKFSASDQVNNRTSWDAYQLSKRSLAVSFNQTGVNDRIAPAITGMSVIGGRDITSAGDSTVVELAYTDAGGHGIAATRLTFDVLQSSPKQKLVFSSSPGFMANPTNPPVLSSTCPASVADITVGCQLSGDVNAGVVRLRVYYQKGSVISSGGNGKAQRGVLSLNSYVAMDALGNLSKSKTASNSLKASSLLNETFGISHDKDRTAPTLVSATATTSRVDTAMAEQSVDYTVVAKDTGKGVKSARVYVMNNGMDCDGTFICGSDIPYCKEIARKAISRTTLSVTTRCTLPAHFASGVYNVAIALYDKSANGNFVNFSGAQLARWNFPSTLTNG